MVQAFVPVGYPCLSCSTTTKHSPLSYSNSKERKTFHVALHCILYSRKIWQVIKFGGLAVYLCNRQIKIRQYFLLAYIRIEIPYRTAKLNPPIFLQWRFWVQLPNLIPANIFGYTVLCY